MKSASFANRENLEVLEAAYQHWRQDPSSVSKEWQLFFEGFELGQEREYPAGSALEANLVRLVDAYRDLGHFQARVDPLSEKKESFPLLGLREFGIEEGDLDRPFASDHFLGLRQGTLRELLAALQETYCRTIGVEFMHIQDTRIRRWLLERIEPHRNQPNFLRRQKYRTLM